jgi:hypothetical protein
MTDEKKPPQEVAASAQIVVDINQDGSVHMTATCWGEPDSTYAAVSDQRLLAVQIPFVLAELRLQLKLGRRLKVEESTAVMGEVCQLSGSAKIL